VQLDEYIETRVRQYQDWYGRKASSENSATLNTMTVAGEVTVAFDAHRDGAGADDAGSSGAKLAAAAASSRKGED
jgi:hypothetical protein